MKAKMNEQPIFHRRFRSLLETERVLLLHRSPCEVYACHRETQWRYTIDLFTLK